MDEQRNTGRGADQLAAPLPPRVRCITHGATLIADPLVAAPGEIVSLVGAGIGPGAPASAALDAEGKISASLAGVSVWFNGTPGLPQGVIQINALLPNSIPVNASPDRTTISVSIADVDSPRIPLWIGPSSR